MESYVYVVDDSAAVRTSLWEVLWDARLDVRLFESAEAMLDTVGIESTGCVLLDVHLQGMDGLQAQAVLQERCIEMPVIFLTGHGDVSTSVSALRAGAFDFLEKPVAEGMLVERVRSALQFDEGQRAARSERSHAQARLRRLSDREREVATMLLDGWSGNEVARALGVSPRTIQSHRHAIMSLTKVSSLLELERVCLLAEARLDDIQGWVRRALTGRSASGSAIAGRSLAATASATAKNR
jgi:two-component system, LuxR family, response regulator FixJ